jgi:putative transcriptional regulator
VFDSRHEDWRALALGHNWSRLRTERFWAGLSQEELAAAVGASRQTISSLERGRSIPSLTLALGIAHELGASVDELFAGDDLR